MADSTTTKIRGLYLQGNDINAPEGSLAVAENAVVSRDDIVEPRRGLPIVSAKQLARLFPFGGGFVGWGANTLRHSADGIAWSDYAGSYAPPSPFVVRAVQAASNLYATTAAGLQRIESLAGPVYTAGIPAALDMDASLVGSGSGAYAFGAQAAYRCVWGRRDQNGRIMLGAPSGRAITDGSHVVSGNAVAALTVRVPPAVDGQFFLQVYRSAIVPAPQTPNDELGMVAEAQYSGFTARVVSQTRVGTYVNCTTDAPHGWDASAPPLLYIPSTDPNFPPLQATFAGITGASTFQYAQAGAAVSGSTAFTAEVVGVALVDSAPFTQASLYTNDSQQGALQGNERPGAPSDAIAFRGMLITAGGADWPRVSLTLLGVGSSGLQANDTITINGQVFTFKAAVVGTYDLLLDPSADPAVAIANTARWMCNHLNVIRPRVCTARYVSGDNDYPGKVVIEATTPTGALTVSVSRPATWSPKAPQVEPTPPNRVRWSKKDEPDAFPLVNVQRVGTDGDACLRLAATRDNVFILKGEDGTFRLTGETPQTIRIDPFDVNTKLVAPETAIVTDNKVFALTEQGVEAIADNGAEVVSRDIESFLFPLLAGAMRPVTQALAFAIAYESSRLYVLYLPSSPSDTVCTQAWVYNLVTQGWTGPWTVPALHGIVNPADDRLYLVDGTNVRRERKDFAATDYADDTASVTIVSDMTSAVTLADASAVTVGDVISQGSSWGIVIEKDSATCYLDRDGTWTGGAATVYKAYPFTVEYLPKFAPPGMMHHFQGCGLSFRETYAAQAALSFATDIDPALESVQIDSHAEGWSGEQPHASVWSIIPRNKARGGLLRVRYAQRQAWAAAKIQGLKVAYSPGTAPAPRRVAPDARTGALGKRLGTPLGGP